MTEPPPVHHPIFARAYAAAMRLAADGFAEDRRRLLDGLEGRVLEVGAGTGSNFEHYPATVELVVALEPEAHLRRLAETAAADASVRVEVRTGDAHRLELEDHSIDAAVASLVLCSVQDPRRALDELHRVVRPGGELRFYEHVRSTSPRAARVQERADVVWPRLFGGCHTARDTAAAIEAAGWEVVELHRLSFRPAGVPSPITPHIVGRARRP